MRIAIVEDEKKLARLIRTALIGEGFQVDTVFDGSTALELIQNTSFDAVILDIMLPGRDGLS
ncbi:MAG: response regulator, partial [Verrucomicrobia bacterium]|nr:response regulator [Verrucomicrobiota bacterium]